MEAGVDAAADQAVQLVEAVFNHAAEFVVFVNHAMAAGGIVAHAEVVAHLVRAVGDERIELDIGGVGGRGIGERLEHAAGTVGDGEQVALEARGAGAAAVGEGGRAGGGRQPGFRGTADRLERAGAIVGETDAAAGVVGDRGDATAGPRDGEALAEAA